MGDFFSKSKPQTETKTSSTAIDPWLASAAQSNINTANGLPASVPFTGTGVAGLTPAQLQAIQQAQGQSGRFNPAFDAAIGGATNGMNFTTPQLNVAGINSDVAGLMNPYQQRVVDASSAEINRQRQMRGLENDSRAGRFHALGSDNNEIVNTENNRNFDTINATTSGNLLKGGYDTALQTALSLGQGNQNAAIQGAGVRNNAVNALTGAATAGSQAGWNDVTGLLGAGNVQQQTDQAGKTFDYNEFLRQQQSPFTRLQAMIQATNGAPHGTTGTETGTKQIYSSPFGQLAGLGLGLAGMMGTGGMSTLGSGAFGLLSNGMMGSGSFNGGR